MMLFLNIYLLLGIAYYMVRTYLENDAMIKAKYLAKEYMEEQKISTEEEIRKIVLAFNKTNKSWLFIFYLSSNNKFKILG